MKIKIGQLRRGKRVYYFDHRHGVLKNKTNSRYQILTSLMTFVLVFGGGGMVINKFVDEYQQANNKSLTSHQSQTVGFSTAEPKSEASDKLKNATPKAREDQQLAKEIRNKLKNIPGGQKWSVYVRDVNSDRMASINADSIYEASGFGDLFVTVPLEAEVPSSNWGYKAGKSTVSKCVIQMISTSETACTQSIQGMSDLKNSESVLDSQGFKKTKISAKTQETTAREMGELLFRLQHGQILSDKARRTVFDGLYDQEAREGIPAGCDQKCLVANITSEGKNVRHDAAIVTSGKAQYVVVVMTNNASWSQIADISGYIRQTLQP